MKIAVVGAGTMGSRVALRSARYGYEVAFIARSIERGRAALESVSAEPMIESLSTEPAIDLPVSREVDSAVSRAVLERIDVCDDLSACASAELVYEAIPEILADKQRLLADVEAFVDDHVPLVSGTSTFFPDKLGFYLEFPKRVFVAHFVHPVTLCPLAEIVEPRENTDPRAAATLNSWIERLALEPIRLATPLPGFIVNRLQFALLREALHIVEKGGATAEDVDRIMRLGLGPRWTATGPIESVALGGPATFADVARSVVPTLDISARIPLIDSPDNRLPRVDPERRTRALARRAKAYSIAGSLAANRT